MHAKTVRPVDSLKDLEDALGLGTRDCGFGDLLLVSATESTLRERGLLYTSEVRDAVVAAKQIHEARRAGSDESEQAMTRYGQRFSKLLDIHTSKGAAALQPYADIIGYLSDLHALTRLPFLRGEQEIALDAKAEAAFRLFVTLPRRLEPLSAAATALQH